jgi:hypothetical protein
VTLVTGWDIRPKQGSNRGCDINHVHVAKITGDNPGSSQHKRFSQSYRIRSAVPATIYLTVVGDH